jgi:hypothetical protein
MTTQDVLQSEPGQHPVARISAPWRLKAESYVLFLKLGTLSEGTYSPLEETWADEELGTFMGGVGTVMIVRYSDTPVGKFRCSYEEAWSCGILDAVSFRYCMAGCLPAHGVSFFQYVYGSTNQPAGSYDELLLIPGTFSVPQPSKGPPEIPRYAQRVSRIYVSQRTTAYNGRLNWNIPKHLARFVFSSPPHWGSATPLTVQVFPPGTVQGDGAPPFFACTLTPWTWVPALPINTRYFPKTLVIAQPPIPESANHRAAAEEALAGPSIDPYDLDPRKELSICVGTTQWCTFSVTARVSRTRGCWVEVLSDKGVMSEEDKGKTWFPSNLKTWRVGIWCEEVEWTVGKPVGWEL